jgi:hypothetical protein
MASFILGKLKIVLSKNIEDNFFWGRIPGDIEWLAQIDEVDIKLVSENDFGQASSGSLVLTGPLGVLRIEKDGLALPSTGDDSMVHMQRSLEIHWDTEEMERQFSKTSYSVVRRYSRYGSTSGKGHSISPQDVFYMPVRLMDYDVGPLDYQVPMLQGLPLRRGKTSGQFRRVGHFRISAQCCNGTADIAAFRNKTKILDPRYYISAKKNGDYTILIT